MTPQFWSHVGSAGDAILSISAAYVALRLLRGRRSERAAEREPDEGRKAWLASNARIHLALATYQRDPLLYAILLGAVLKLASLVGPLWS